MQTLYLVLGLIVIAVAVTGGFWFLRQRSRSTPPPPTRNAAPQAAAPQARPVAVLAFPPRETIPSELTQFQRIEVFDLPIETLQSLRRRLAQVQRPPQGIDALLSPEFLEQATSEALSELILAEPHVAAKVLATVNSPFYGLSQPVSSVQQGITYLGLDTVRGICLQYLMSESLRPSDPRLKPVFDLWWDASAIASQLCLKLGYQAGIADPASLVTQVVLSFLGHMVALPLLPPEVALSNAQANFFERTRKEQEFIGLSAGELGCMMMTEWRMPTHIVEDVRAAERLLTTPPTPADGERGVRLALSYYCARVGEKLASKAWTQLQSARPDTLQDPEFFHLQSHFMQHPELTQLALDFQDPGFIEELAYMVQMSSNT